MLFQFCSKATNLAVVMPAALTRVETLTIVSMFSIAGILDVKHMAYCSAACMQAACSKAEA